MASSCKHCGVPKSSSKLPRTANWQSKRSAEPPAGASLVPRLTTYPTLSVLSFIPCCPFFVVWSEDGATNVLRASIRASLPPHTWQHPREQSWSFACTVFFLCATPRKSLMNFKSFLVCHITVSSMSRTTAASTVPSSRGRLAIRAFLVPALAATLAVTAWALLYGKACFSMKLYV